MVKGSFFPVLTCELMDGNKPDMLPLGEETGGAEVSVRERGGN